MAVERTAADSLEISLKVQKLGTLSYLTALNAQQAYQKAVINLIQAQANRFADTAPLFQALGAGWWNRNDYDLSNMVAVADDRSQSAKLT